jgi:transposase InsO family protein
MDHFSKFHILFPLRKKTAEEVSYMLEERVLAYLGPPKIFHSDNGRKFVNNLIHAIFKRWGGDVTFVNGRPRHSQSQGLIERGNRTLEMKIAVMKQDEGHTGFKYPWVSWLPRIMFSMNSEKHEGIKDSPYHVVFGRHSPTGFFPGAVKHCVDEEDICTDGEKKTRG